MSFSFSDFFKPDSARSGSGHGEFSSKDELNSTFLSADSNPYAAPGSSEIEQKSLVPKLEAVLRCLRERLEEGAVPVLDFYEFGHSLLQQAGILHGRFSQENFIATYHIIEKCKRWNTLKDDFGTVVKGFAEDFVSLVDVSPTEYMREQEQLFLEARLNLRSQLARQAALGMLTAQDIITGVTVYLSDQVELSQQRTEVLQKYLQTEMANDLPHTGIVGRYLEFSPLLFDVDAFNGGINPEFNVSGSDFSDVEITEAVRRLAFRVR